ncbi:MULTISPECIES: hypothetical protein [Trichocoleus]|uniref:Uncharacterized protein n=1 Tax=Trichocoleus desertorum GB2-A4 TaxID=2933944 RepID=A0ABV0JCM0_9CYAN|nr:hypothetical protein [Trichocoleus sp. FACHB-46]MBD1864181.1 hypothetical protein [Trichocoleus sp. FACHB-46]
MGLDSPTKEPLTNLSINSKAGVEHEIQRQERVHWFLGLRQAELFIQEKRAALETNYHLQRKHSRQVKTWEKELQTLQELEQPSLEQLDQIEALQDDIAAAKSSQENLQPLIRDCGMELHSAEDQKQRILQAHPEAIDLSYIELQTRYSAVALLEKQAHVTAAEIWASHNALPVSVGHLLFDLSPADRDYVLAREMELRNGVKVGEAIAHAAQVLATLSPETQKQVLLQAAQTVMNSSALTHE